ncbi:MAG: molecular chaperone TorD family protein [Litorilinea sp.]
MATETQPSTGDALDAAQLADGRARLYTLLAHLTGAPMTADRAPLLAAWPPLQAAYAALPTSDRARAAHYETILGYQIPPFGGLFLNPDAMLGGPFTAALARFYATAGYGTHPHSGGDDHLANLLSCLAHLNAAESEAWQDHAPPIAHKTQTLQRHLLENFLLPWLPPLTHALHQSRDDFYAAVGELLGTALTDHWANHGEALTPPADVTAVPAPETLPSIPWLLPPDLPDLSTAGTRTIAGFLCRPQQAGFYLSPVDLQRLGHHFGIAAGFGGRRRQLETLLQTIPLAELPALLHQLATHAQQWDDGYATLALQHSPLVPYIQPWRARIQATRTLIENMLHQVATT